MALSHDLPAAGPFTRRGFGVGGNVQRAKRCTQCGQGDHQARQVVNQCREDEGEGETHARPQQHPPAAESANQHSGDRHEEHGSGGDGEQCRPQLRVRQAKLVLHVGHAGRPAGQSHAEYPEVQGCADVTPGQPASVQHRHGARPAGRSPAWPAAQSLRAASRRCWPWFQAEEKFVPT